MVYYIKPAQPFFLSTKHQSADGQHLTTKHYINYGSQLHIANKLARKSKILERKEKITAFGISRSRYFTALLIPRLF